MWLSLNTLIHVVREDNTEVSLERKFEHEKCRCHTVEAFFHMERGKLDPFSGCGKKVLDHAAQLWRNQRNWYVKNILRFENLTMAS